VTFFADFTSGQSNVSYTRMRQLLATSGGGLQEGVIGAGDLKVAQRAAGANMSVDVAVGDAWVQYDTGSRNGLSHVWSDAIANVAFNASDATNPRVDQIGVQLNDTSVGAGTGGNTPTLRYLPGTATAGATLANRTGAAAAPNDWMRLADVLVPATSTSVTTANIVDRRPWARGAKLNMAGTGLGDVPGISTSVVQVAGITDQRLECSGTLLEVTFDGNCSHGTAGQSAIPLIFVDGAEVARKLVVSASAAADVPFTVVYSATPAAGSHLFGVRMVASAASAVLRNTATNLPRVLVTEVVRPNANNS
jgi:hypothetical protein